MAVVKFHVINSFDTISGCISKCCLNNFRIASFLAMTIQVVRHCEERSNPEGVCNAILNYSLNN